VESELKIVPAIKNSSCVPRGEAFQLAFCSGDLKNQLLGAAACLHIFMCLVKRG